MNWPVDRGKFSRDLGENHLFPTLRPLPFTHAVTRQGRSKLHGFSTLNPLPSHGPGCVAGAFDCWDAAPLFPSSRPLQAMNIVCLIGGVQCHLLRYQTHCEHRLWIPAGRTQHAAQNSESMAANTFRLGKLLGGCMGAAQITNRVSA